MESKIRLLPNVTIQKVEKEDSESNPASEVSDTSSSFYETGDALEDAANLKDLSENSSFLRKEVIPDINLTYEELVSIKTKDLNKLLKDIPKERVVKIKSIRRTLKNRGYAASSRVRSLAEKEDVEKEIGQIHENAKKVNEEINLCTYRLNVLKESCDQLLHTLDRHDNSEELKADIKAKVSQRMALLVGNDPEKVAEVEELLKCIGTPDFKMF